MLNQIVEINCHWNKQASVIVIKNIMPSEYLKDYSLKSNYDKINLFAFFLILHRLKKIGDEHNVLLLRLKFQNPSKEGMTARSNELAEVRKKLSEALGEHTAAYFLHLRSLNILKILIWTYYLS